MRKNPLSFNGRIRRAEYVVSFFAYLFAYYFAFGMDQGRGGGPIAIILVFPTLWFAFAQGAKRMHDIDKSGWWQAVPFYNLWLLFQPGMRGPNQYGEDPKVEPYQDVDESYDKPQKYRRPEDPKY